VDDLVDARPRRHREGLEELRRRGPPLRPGDPGRRLHALRLVPPLRRPRPTTRSWASTRGRWRAPKPATGSPSEQTRRPRRRDDRRSGLRRSQPRRPPPRDPHRYPLEHLTASHGRRGPHLPHPRRHARVLLPRRRRRGRHDGAHHGRPRRAHPRPRHRPRHRLPAHQHLPRRHRRRRGRPGLPARPTGSPRPACRRTPSPRPEHRPAVFAGGASLSSPRRTATTTPPGSGSRSLPFRSAWAVAAANAVYRDIGRLLLRRGAAAWEGRAATGRGRKLALVLLAGGTAAAARLGGNPESAPRDGLWTRPAAPQFEKAARPG
jgi:hypothetical protein